jgi:molybdenum cofactor cytidylyltransferase
MTLGIIFMASGLSRRFGSNKLLYKLDGKPLYLHALSSLIVAAEELKRDCSVSIAVVSQYSEILTEAEKLGLLAVHNPDSEEGITASIKLGLKSLPASEHYAFFVADQPFLKSETTAAFIRQYLVSTKGIGSVSDGRLLGNPCVFSRKYLPELSVLEGDRGGKQVIMKHPEDIFDFRIEPNELFDLDRPEDLR